MAIAVASAEYFPAFYVFIVSEILQVSDPCMV